MLLFLERAPLSVGKKMAIGFGDSLLLLHFVYVYESKVWIWYFVVQQNNHSRDGLDGLLEHRFDVKQCVVP